MYTRKGRIYPTQMDTQALGKLQVQVVCEIGSRPVENATVQIFRKEDQATAIEVLSTDISGKTIEVDLPTPPLVYSMEPQGNKPYAEYIIVIQSSGLQTVKIDSAQLLPYIKSIQPVRLPRKLTDTEEIKIINITPHYLYGSYPPKVYEDEVKSSDEPVDPNSTEKSIVIPEFVVVHDGIPMHADAKNYTIEYKDYIKNVICSMTYATWPLETIYANILAILSFTLNRIFTNWYPTQGYNFTITNSTAYDNLWIYGRNIDNNISIAVDYFFNYFLSRPDIFQPILTQTCRGALVDCPNMLSLWGSKFLGDKNYDALGILKYYYGNTIFINSTNNVVGIPTTWPGRDLSLGSEGEDVKIMQNQLNTLSKAYTAIPPLEGNGIFDETLENAVKTFQTIFNLPVTGMIDVATWYSISQIYTRVTRASGLCRENQ
jgi:peptidoglycan hydrolase-like protein with peptidoglycan-binding domain